MGEYRTVKSYFASLCLAVSVRLGLCLPCLFRLFLLLLFFRPCVRSREAGVYKKVCRLLEVKGICSKTEENSQNVAPFVSVAEEYLLGYVNKAVLDAILVGNHKIVKLGKRICGYGFYIHSVKRLLYL